ncbi:MAG: dephospho-CoA kinase [Bacilli bacterium]
MVVGLTGGISTGKSTVSAMFLHRGAYIIDCDIIAREVVAPGEVGLSQLVIRFGKKILLDDGTLNRKMLGAIIFNDKDARKALNEITHPLIRARVKRYIKENLLNHPSQIIIVDVPLLFEGNLAEIMDETVVVYVSEPIQLARLVERDKLTIEEAKTRIGAQMPIEEKRKLADIVIDNSGEIEQTEEQVDLIWGKWQREANE